MERGRHVSYSTIVIGADIYRSQYLHSQDTRSSPNDLSQSARALPSHLLKVVAIRAHPSNETNLFELPPGSLATLPGSRG